MPQFAANLTLMFTEVPFLDRFAAAREAGFEFVEFMFPYAETTTALADQLSAHGLTQVLFNLAPGDFAAGERGIAALPQRFEDLKESVAQALDYAAALGTKRLHLMAGLASPEDADAVAAYRRSVIYTAEKLAAHDIDLVIEPINGRNMPGFFLNDFNVAAHLIRELALPNLKLLFDCYHRQILHGDVVIALRELMPIIGHMQVASIPSRNEPDAEELNYPYVFAQIDRLGYRGYVGCEYNPRGETTDGLEWFGRYKRRS